MKTLIQYSPLIFMLVVVYLVILVPERKRKKEYRGMLDNLKVNDEIMTKGGIIGKIINMQGRFVVLQTGPDKVRIKIDKTGVLNLLTAIEEYSNKDDKKEEKSTENQ
ncbi:preprotein translocase subunit YajC [Clostridium scatologenes]|uniref:Preprotein translocase, YajC subunit n=1 Tax=Clostridium scatologenes TaxID=1548 RepID=A0A0E3MAD5_CLOSL|nr:preprotein translocase subunit YajC [Clostridium scatologenes]AKA71984.1 preprotein translocase, YajC subunit [Clostridium scatologenes]